MNMNQTSFLKDSTVVKFFRRFGYYMIAGALVVAIGISLSILAAQTPPIDDGLDVGGGVITFALPMSSLELLKDFSSTELFFNATLKQWEAHKAVALKGNASDVFAVLDGTVKSVYNTHLEGTVVIIEHADGLQTCYRSLDSATTVQPNSVVKRGDKIGTTSASAGAELYLGDHLTFEVIKDNVKLDPNLYLDFGNK